MFWKKKKISTEKFIHESSDKRETFRFEFDLLNSFEIEFKEKNLPLINLSATGMSFSNDGLAADDCGMVKFFFTFTNIKSPVSIKLEMQIIRIDENNICHAIFTNCSEENKEIIHKYILEKQKEKIRGNKIIRAK
ncbi:MAG: PilZ domain-containing protein [Desulfobacteraceae bacterium]|nr:PilZ domain-containing protein [Desulfobacteraceae bacterium]